MAKKASGGKKKKLHLKRKAISTVLVLLILYVGTHLLSRTEGVRSAVADKISNGTRQPVSLEKCGMTPLLGLHLEGLSFEGVAMPDVRMAFDWFSWISKKRPFVKELRIDGLEITFRRVPTTGNWEPLVLSGIGQRLGASLGVNLPQAGPDESLPTFPPYAVNAHTLLQLDGAKAVWRDESDREVAYITDAELSVRAESFRNRKAIQTIVECGHVKLANGRSLRDFRLEVFRIQGSEVVIVLDMADSNGEYPEFASITLWDDLNMHLNQLTAIR